jgi:hypothetical protein
MIMENEEKMDVTGLSTASNKKEAEYDLVKSLLEAADFRNSEDLITKIEIKRAGKFLFEFRVRPLGDEEGRTIRKKATKYMPNPNGKKLPPIEKEFNSALFHSWMIYTATVEEDKQRIWGNKTVMEKYDCMQPVDMVDILLRSGEKMQVAEIISDISGMSDDDDSVVVEEYAKNS